MSTNITVKNIPDEIYSSLKRVAETHRRSINSEIISCLERAVAPSRVTNEQLLARARIIRQSLQDKAFSPEDIQAAIAHGRP